MKRTLVYFQILSLLFSITLLTATPSLGEEFVTKQRANSNEKNRIHHLFFNNQDQILIGSIGWDRGAIAFWSLGDGRLEHLIDLGKMRWVRDMALSQDGSLIALTLFGDYRMNNMDEVGTYSIVERRWLWKKGWEWKSTVGSSIGFLPDGKTFIVLGFERMITFDAQTGVVLRDEKSPSEIRKGYHCLSQTGRYAAAWGPREMHTEMGPPFIYLTKKWVFVFDIIQGRTILDTGKFLKPYKNRGGVFTPDEKYLVLGSMGGMISVWSVDRANIIREWRAFGEDEILPHAQSASPYNIDSIVFSPDGRLVATEGIENGFHVRVWDYSDNRLLKSFENVVTQGGHRLCANYPMAFSPDGKLFAFEQRGKLCLYNTQTWGEKWCVPSWAEDK